MSAEKRLNVLYFFFFFFNLLSSLLTILSAEIPISFLFEVFRSNFLLAFNDVSLRKSHKSLSLLVFKSQIFESSMLQRISLNCRLLTLNYYFKRECIYVCISIYKSLSCTCMHNLTHRAGIYSVSALEWHCEGTRQYEGFSRVKWPFASSKRPQEWWLPGGSPQGIMRIIIIENLLHERSSDEMGQSWCCNSLTRGANLHSHSHKYLYICLIKPEATCT